MDEEKKETPRPRRRVGGIVLIVLAVPAVLAVLLAGLVIGRRQAPRIAMQPSLKETRHTAQVISKLANSLVTPDGRIAQEATVALAPQEVDALLAAGIRAYQFKHHDAADPVCWAAMQNGAARMELSLPIGGGFAVNAAANLRPSLVNGSLRVKVASLRLGWLPLHGALAESVADRAIAELAKKPEYQLAVQVIKQASLREDGTLVVTFVPTRISALLALLMQGR